MCSESPEAGFCDRRSPESLGPPATDSRSRTTFFLVTTRAVDRADDFMLIDGFPAVLSANFRFPRSDDVRPIGRRARFAVDSAKTCDCRISSTDNKSFNFGCHFLTRDGTRQSLVP